VLPSEGLRRMPAMRDAGAGYHTIAEALNDYHASLHDTPQIVLPASANNSSTAPSMLIAEQHSLTMPSSAPC